MSFGAIQAACARCRGAAENENKRSRQDGIVARGEARAVGMTVAMKLAESEAEVHNSGRDVENGWDRARREVQVESAGPSQEDSTPAPQG